MSLCFRSFSEGDAEDYYGSIDAAEHYNRGYYDGQEDARREHTDDLHKTYKKGFEDGRKKAVEDLMKNLFDLFGDDIAVAYLDTMTSRVLEDSDEIHLEPELANDSEEPVNDDSLDDKILEYVNSENASINDIIHNEFSSYGSITLKDEEINK